MRAIHQPNWQITSSDSTLGTFRRHYSNIPKMSFQRVFQFPRRGVTFFHFVSAFRRRYTSRIITFHAT